MASEQTVIIHGPYYAVLPTTCEVLDTEDRDSKIFRFKHGCKWLSEIEIERAGSKPVTKISVFSYCPQTPEDERDPVKGIPGECEGRYRVTAELDAPAGYIAVFAGTTSPEAPAPQYETQSTDELKCEIAILEALQAEPRMSLYALKRKIHAERFGIQLWEKCLRQLSEAGEIRIEEQRGVNGKARVWVIYCDDTHQDVTASAPKNDGTFGANQTVEK